MKDSIGYKVVNELRERYGLNKHQAIACYIDENKWLREWLKNPVNVVPRSSFNGFRYKGIPYEYQTFRYEGTARSINKVIEGSLLSYLIFGVQSDKYGLPMKGFVQRKMRLPVPEDEVQIIYGKMYSALVPPVSMVGPTSYRNQYLEQYGRIVHMELNFITDGVATLDFNKEVVGRYVQ